MLKQKTVYFREEDLESWAAVENKAQWLHDHLSVEKPVTVFKTTPIPVSAEVVSEDVTLVKPRGANLCKVHGLPLTLYGKCLQKGCKYA